MTLMIFHTAFRALGGPGEIRLAAPDEETARQRFRIALDEIDRIEIKYSRYRETSLISRINRSAGGAPVACDPETLGLLEVAHSLHAQSGGRFDLTSGVWRRIWNFRDPHAAIPDETARAAWAPLVGWHMVERSDQSVRLPLPGMELDLGGIGKEYAVDRCAVVLTAAGVRHGLINLAGDLRAIGGKPDGRPWQVGVQHPERPDATIAEIDLVDEALTTSGDYERCLRRDGQRFGHLLNARTGCPVSHWRSVSVKAPSALFAGSLSTMAMLMELEGLELLQHSGLDFLAIDALGQLHTRASSSAPL